MRPLLRLLPCLAALACGAGSDEPDAADPLCGGSMLKLPEAGVTTEAGG